MLSLITALLSKKVEEVKEDTTVEVYLYTRSTSKASSKKKCWYWTSYPSSYALANDITILRTKVRVNISDMNYTDHKNGTYTVVFSNKSLQRKLLSMSTVYSK